MIVTASTGQRESQKRSPDDVDFVVDVVGNHLLLIDVTRNEIGNRQHPSGDERIGIDLVRVGRLQQVAGKLLSDEFVVRQIPIECGDDPIAITPCLAEVAFDRQLNEIASIGIADDVQPMPPPPLAITGRREQPIDNFRIGVGRVVVQVFSQFFRSRRQSRQIKTDPAKQRALVSGRRRI